MTHTLAELAAALRAHGRTQVVEHGHTSSATDSTARVVVGPADNHDAVAYTTADGNFEIVVNDPVDPATGRRPTTQFDNTDDGLDDAITHLMTR